MSKIIIQISKDLEELVPTFLETRHKEIVKLEKLFADKNLDEICFIAHKLAGNAGGYGFQELTEIGRRLEMASKEKIAEQVGVELQNIKRYLEEIEVEFV